MTSEWTTVKLSDVAKIIGGGTPSTSESNYWDGNIPWITPKDLSSHKDMYISCGSRSITDAGLKNSSAKLVPKDTVLFTSRAPIGYVAIASQAICTNQGFKSLVLNEGYDSRYFYYLLKHYTPEIEARATGSTFKEISGTALGSFEISIPPAFLQKRIAEILSSLDDRIALLRETNQTLEAIAQALFKSWFVDFDPVRAKAEGRLPEGIDAATAEHFPDAFEESELGLIPRGWDVESVGELLSRPKVTKRYTKNQVVESGEFPVYEQGASILLGFHNDEPSCNATPEKPLFIFGDHTCITKLSCEPFDISQNVILLEGSKRNSYWTYYAIQGKQKFEEYRRHWMELIVKKIILPDPMICDLFASTTMPLQLKIEANSKQLNTLSNLRDTLLPRLISGQLRIADAETELEKATA